MTSNIDQLYTAEYTQQSGFASSPAAICRRACQMAARFLFILLTMLAMMY